MVSLTAFLATFNAAFFASDDLLLIPLLRLFIISLPLDSKSLTLPDDTSAEVPKTEEKVQITYNDIKKEFASIS